MARQKIAQLVDPRKERMRQQMLANAGQISDSFKSGSISQASVPDPEKEPFMAAVYNQYGPKLSKDAVQKILDMHGTSMSDLVGDLGDKATYATRKVINWLGY